MKKILFILIMSIFIIPTATKGADTYTLLAPLPCVTGDTNNNCTSTGVIKEVDLSTYIGYIYKFSMALAVFLAIMVIIYAGFQYMTTDSIFSKEEGRKRIQSAITGLLLVLSSYLILRTIDPRLVEIGVTIDPIKVNVEKVTKFQTQLSEDLQNYSNEAKIETQKNNLLKKETQNKIKDFENRIARNEILTEEDQKSYELLKSELREIETNITTSKSKDMGFGYYNETYSLLAKKDLTSEEKLLLDINLKEEKGALDADSKGIYPVNVLNPLIASYNNRINQLPKTDSVARYRLTKQRNFFVDQIKEDKDLFTTINNYKEISTIKANSSNNSIGSFGGGAGSILSNEKNTETLKAKLTQYENELKEKTPDELMNDEFVKIKGTGITNEQYQNILKTRIELINQTLGIKK